MSYTADDINKARGNLALLCAAFGVEPPPLGSEGGALKAILEGRLSYDAQEEKAVYTLAAPIKGESHTALSEVSFDEGNSTDQEYIHAGIKQLKATGEAVEVIDLGDRDLMAKRMIERLGGVNVGLVDKIKARDFRTLKEVFELLGFFD